jgi:hypothetical protein
MFSFSFINMTLQTLQEETPGWYQLLGILVCSVRPAPMLRQTYLSVPGSNLFSIDRENLASSSASSATDTYRGISVIVFFLRGSFAKLTGIVHYAKIMLQ